jgi:drug/metabolite transporter (DMT)-like permease
MWSTGSFLSSRITLPANPLAATSWEMLAGGLIMFPASLFTIHGGIHPSTQSIVGWIYLVTFGSIIGYTAYVWLLANAPLGLVSTYAYVNPVVAITLGVIFLDESLTWHLLIGAVIVVFAVAMVVRQEPAPSTELEHG